MNESFEYTELKMICRLCSESMHECKTLQEQHLEMLKIIDADHPMNDSKCICTQCECLLFQKYQTNLQQEAEQKKLQLQLENEKLKEILNKLKNDLDNTTNSSSNFSENFHEDKIKIEKLQAIDDGEIFDIKVNTASEKFKSLERCYDQEELKKHQQQMNNLNNSICNFSGNCPDAEIKIEKSEIMAIEEFPWNDNATTKLHNSEHCNEQKKLDDQQQFVNPSKSSSSFLPNCHEAEIKIEKSETMDIEEDNSTTDHCYGQEQLNEQQNFNSRDSSSFSLSDNNYETRIKIAKSEAIDIEEFSWTDNTTTEIFKSQQRCHDEEEVNESAVESTVMQNASNTEHALNSAALPTNSNALRQNNGIGTDGLLLLAKITEKVKSKKERNINWSSTIKKLNDDFYCCICGDGSNKYTCRAGVITHIKVHHIGCRFPCTECKHYFKERTSLKNHYKKKHNISNGSFDFEIVDQQNDRCRNAFKKQSNGLSPTTELSAQKCNIVQNVSTIDSLPNKSDNKVLPNEINWNSLLKLIDTCFHCVICNDSSKTYRTMDNVKIHILTDHYGYRYYECNECKRIYSKRWDLGIHYKNIHNITMPQKDMLPSIPFAEYKPNYTKLKNENDNVRGQIDKTKFSTISDSQYDDINWLCLMGILDDAFYCFICGDSSKKYSTRQGVVMHSKVNHFGYRLTCTECKRNFKVKIHLQQHYEKIHNITNGKIDFKNVVQRNGNPIEIDYHFCFKSTFLKIDNYYECNHCLQKFLCPVTLEIHKKNAHNSVLDRGDLVPNSSESNLLANSNDSSDEFKQKSANKVQQQLHNIASESNDNLTEDLAPRLSVLQHQKPLSHNNINYSKFVKKIDHLFYCNLCSQESKIYANMRTIKAHIQIDHYGYKYLCTECKCIYRASKDLRNHYVVSHGITNGCIRYEIVSQNPDKPCEVKRQLLRNNILYKYECKECGLRFSTTNLLENHIQEYYQS